MHPLRGLFSFFSYFPVLSWFFFCSFVVCLLFVCLFVFSVFVFLLFFFVFLLFFFVFFLSFSDVSVLFFCSSVQNLIFWGGVNSFRLLITF